jgi:autotransporter-associated beta strand protein
VQSFKRFLVPYIWINWWLILGGSSFLLIGSATLNAQTPTEIWTDTTGDNSWFTAGNWAPSIPPRIPISTDTVTVNNGTTAQIGAPNAVAASLFIGDSLTGSIAVPGSTVQLLPTGSLGSGANPVNVIIGLDGTLRFSGGSLTYTSLQNNGTIVFEGAFSHSFTAPITGSGNFVLAGGTLAINSTMGTAPNLFVNSGVATFNFPAAMTAGTISVNGGTLQIAATGEAVSTLTIGTTAAGSTVQLLPTGNPSVADLSATTIVIGPGGTLRFSGGPLNWTNLQNNGTIVFEGAFNHFFNVPITGSGNFILAGGTLAINATMGTAPNLFVNSGVATFNFPAAMTAGTISVNGGTLQIAATGEAVDSLSIGTTAAGSTLQLLPGGSLTVTNPVIIGTGGTLRFSGGGTSGGTLVASVIQDNGNIVFDGPLSHSLVAAVSGSGNLTMAGTGTLNLSGNLAYSGSTTISSGIVQAGSTTGLSPNSAFTVNSILDLNGFNSTIGSLSGNGTVLNNGSTTAGLTIGNNNATTTFAGVLKDGTSILQLTKSGSGTLILTGNNTYTGGTTISAGTLQVGNGGTTGSITGNVADNGVLVFDRSDSVTFGGVISGPGSLVQQGAGTLTLPGPNTYTGTTTVNAGSLIVDGSIASTQTVVNSGGFLGGHGTIGGNLVNNGTVGQFNSPGTLTVVGNYTQNPGGTLRIAVGGLASTQHDALAANGHVTLGGTLQLNPLGGFTLQPGNQVTFITAKNGVSGSFSTVQNNFGTIVQAKITSLADSVVLEGVQGSFATTPGVATTPNLLAVAKALDSAAGDPRAAALFAFLNSQPLANLPHDLTLIAPIQNSSINATAVSVGNVQMSNLGQRLGSIRAGSTGFSSAGFAINGGNTSFGEGFAGVTGPEGKSGPPVFAPTPENRWGVFVTGLGEFTNVDSTSNAAGYDVDTGGFTLGVDYRVTPNIAIGLTGGYAHTSVSPDGGGNIDVNGGKMGLYATIFGNGFYLDTAVSGGPSGYNIRRTALQGTASGSTDGADLDVLVAAGYDWKKGNLTIGPTASFQFSYIGLNGFTETGSLAPLKFPDQNNESERSAFGAKASYDWKIGHVTVIPQVNAAWQHEYGTTAYSVVANFASGAGNSFTVVGPDIGRDSLLIGAGATVIWNDRVSTYLYYDGEVARTNYESHNVSGGVRISF